MKNVCSAKSLLFGKFLLIKLKQLYDFSEILLSIKSFQISAVISSYTREELLNYYKFISTTLKDLKFSKK